MQRIARRAVLQAVMDGGYTAANLHIVNLSAQQVVVVRISLGHLHPDAVFALQAEHWAGEGVEGLRRVGGVLVGQRYGGLLTGQFAGNIRLIAEVVEVVVAYLLITNLDRIAIDAVVDGVVRQLRFRDCHGINVLVGTCVGGVPAGETVGQVNDLAHLPLLEQCGISLTVHLLYLPAYWRQ